ncbi:MAG TPA: hypothetical protein VLA61_16280 [Ideonella sp.]|uniref:hypothetical protein n=1 Tax=Ideonella sp. TaxID=1929293 RepID=UPI002B9CF17D|nr:hypothetical protein [Ideonella sp.]HSI49830.1 hypothetical protein [Ideonella sp.]
MFNFNHERIRSIRDRAIGDLKSVRIQCADERLTLDANRAEVMDQSETVQHDEWRVDAFYLTQIVRNLHGEYFLLKTTDGRPYVKHLTQARAKLVLKAKYRLPGQPR